MGISKKLELAYKNYLNEDYEEALSQLSIAVDATAKRESYVKSGNGERYKSFLTDNIQIITYLITGVRLNGLQLGKKSLEEILYKSVRCKLLHEASSDDFILSEKTLTGDGRVIPKSIVVALFFVVALSPKNQTEWTKTNLWVIDPNTKEKLYLNDIWGKRHLLLFNQHPAK